MHERAGAEEQRHFDNAVEQHVGHAAEHPLRRQQRHAEEHVGEVAHGGVRQPALEAALAQRHRRRERHGERRRQHADGLLPAAQEQRGAVGVPGEPRHCEKARVHHRHRVQQRRHRRGRDGGSRQPRIEREQRRLRAEAEKAEQEDGAHQLRRILSGEVAAIEEVAAAIQRADDDGDESHRRARDAVDHVLPPGVEAVLVLQVRHQRQRDEGQHLVKNVERHKVRGKRDAQRHAVGHEIEREEHVLRVVALHVLIGVQQRRRPQQRQHTGEQRRHAVHAKAHGKAADKTVDRDALPPREEQQQQREHTRHAGDSHRKAISLVGFFDRLNEKHSSADDRQQDRNEKQHRTHGDTLRSAGCRRRPPPARARRAAASGRS